MRKAKNAFALVIILVACYSCNKKEEKSDESPSSAEVYETPIPLKVGDYWVYDYYEYNYRDSIMVETYKSRRKITVFGDTLIDGKKIYLLDGRFSSYDLSTYMADTFILACKDGVVSDKYRDTIPEWSTNSEAVSNFKRKGLDVDQIKYRYTTNPNTVTFLI